jgi:hypothetical protein
VAERSCIVWVPDMRTGETVSLTRVEDAVQEIFAVQALPGVRCPDVINANQALLADSFVLPGQALDAVPAPLRFPAHPTIAS